MMEASLNPALAVAASGGSPTDALRHALKRVLVAGGPAVARLARARTSVCFSIDGGTAVTLLLDRTPPAVADGAAPAEIEIGLSAQQADEMARGALFLPGAVMSGAVTIRGPVRRYLEFDPVLRDLLAQVSGGAANNTSRRLTAGGTAGGILAVEPDLMAIETRGLEKSFGRHQILRGANLTIPEGVLAVVLGPSGTGKSVLLQHIIGLMRPDGGDVLIRGRPLSRMSRSELLMLRTEIGVMFQDGALFSAMTVADNVAFPLRQHTDFGEDVVQQLVADRLDAVGLSSAANLLPATLSGGMRKRAGLARALVLQPSIVLCDEPDSGLDPVRTALLGELLVQQHAALGGTMIVITHNIALARRIGEHLSVLWQGEILESGLRDDMVNSDNAFIRQFLAGESQGPLGMDA